MKKKIIIISFLSAFLIIISFIFISVKNKNTIKTEVNNMIDDINEIINNNRNKYVYNTDGTISVLANYKGAHGENYPNNFTYGISYKNNTLTMIDEENKKVIEYINNDKVINMINTLSNIKDFNLKVDSIKGNKVVINTKSFNNIFNTNFKNIYLEIKTKGIIKKVEAIYIHLDDISIEKKKSQFKTTINNNNIRLSFSKLGYSLNINDKLKMNVFISEDNDKYSVVLNDYVYLIELNKDGIKVNFNSQSAIYNSIVINYVSGNTIDTTGYIEDETVDNPIKRYLSNSKNDYWR